MNTDPPGALAAAFAVIRDTDPATYERMISSGWTVHVLSPDHTAFLNDSTWSMDDRIAMLMGEAAGMTTRTGKDSIVDALGVKSDAEDTHVPEADYMASTLVHEFTHSRYSSTPHANEHGAFAAELDFDSELGDDALTQATQDVAEKEMSERE